MKKTDLQQIIERFDIMGKRFNTIDKKFDTIGKALNKHDEMFKQILDLFYEHEDKLKEIKETMATKEEVREIKDLIHDSLPQDIRIDQEYYAITAWKEDATKTLERHENDILRIKENLSII
jgi:hypothetical protein